MNIHSIVSVLAALSAVCAMFLAVVYVIIRYNASKAYGLLQQAEGDAIKPIAASYHVIDKKQKQVGVAVLGCFCFTLIALMFFRDNQLVVDVVSRVVAALSVLIVQMSSYHFNLKDKVLQIRARNERKYRSILPEARWQAIS